MYIEIDLTTVPPGVRLVEPEDFGDFKVVVRPSDHAWVDVDTLVRLAGPLAESEKWRADLLGMTRYAESQGWVRDDGAIRGHVVGAE